jgi:hypothetical protein
MPDVSIRILAEVAKANSQLQSLDDRMKGLNASSSTLKLGWTELNSAMMLGERAFRVVANITEQTAGLWLSNTLSVGDFADKLGTTTEEASALREMAGDLNVNLGSLEMGFKVMSRQGIDPSIEGLIEVRRQVLGAGSDSERLALAQKLLGRAGADLIPIFEQLNEEALRGYIDKMGEGQVVTAAEVVQARQLRDALEATSDEWENARLLAGGLAVETLNVSEKLARFNLVLSGQLPFWEGWWMSITGTTLAMREAEQMTRDEAFAIRDLEDAFGSVGGSADDAGADIQGLITRIGKIPTFSDWTFRMHTPWSSEVTELATQMHISPAAAFVMLTHAKVIRQIEQGQNDGGGGGTDTRQSGGDVMRGQPYLVGEAGPELFIPREAGTIINNTQTRSFVYNTTVNDSAGGGSLLERMKQDVRRL